MWLRDLPSQLGTCSHCGGAWVQETTVQGALEYTAEMRPEAVLGLGAGWDLGV